MPAKVFLSFSTKDLDAVTKAKKVTAMKPTTWRLIRDELLTRLPKEVNVTPVTSFPETRFRGGNDLRIASAWGNLISMY